MEVNKIVKNIAVNHQPVCPILYRSYIQSDYGLLITRRMNECLAVYPEMRDTIYALAIYPAIKWAVAVEKEVSTLLNMLKNSDKAVLAGAKTVVETASESLENLIQRRKSYYEACRTLIATVDENLSKIKTYPDHGKKYNSVLQVVIGESYSLEGVTRYNLNKYLPDAIKLLHRCMRESDPTLDHVLTGALPSEEENAFLYQSVTQLLQDYTQLLWLTNNADQNNVLEVAEYTKQLNKVVAQLKSFPGSGNIYYNIIQTVIKLKPLGIPDEVAADKLKMSTYTYSIKKRRALAVLGAILFGCEGDIYVKLLADKF